MILQPFTVNSQGKRWSFMQVDVLASDAERRQVQQLLLTQMAAMQQDAMCAALGIDPSGEFGTLSFGAYESGVLAGVLLVVALDYQSGPWRDLGDWEVVNGNAPAVFHARPMPVFPFLAPEDSAVLSADVAHHLLARRMTMVEGYGVEFRRLGWAIFKERTDANSRAVQAIHEAVKADARFTVTETPDSSDAALTHVDVELR